MICDRIETSSAETGSSNTNISGLDINAAAIAIL